MARKKDKSPESAAEIKPEAEITPTETAELEESAPEPDAAEPTEEKTSKPAPDTPKSSRAFPPKLKRLLDRYWAKKKWTLPITAVALILIILIVPFTRYISLGLFMKSSVTVSLVDSVTSTPVSSAAVTVGGHSVYTNADGKVTSKMKLGGRTLTITKQYYKTSTEHVTVTFSKKHNTFTYHLVANGRQVPITVLNKVTGKPIAGAEVKVQSPNATASKTDKNGKATIVLPTKTTTQKATVTGTGFNALQTTVQITGKDVAANHFNLTPSGKLYFLSNQSGKIDVVKTNLDGTDRQVVLAGTGSEEPYTTSLLASRDWKYLALLSKRSGDNASLYLIDTTKGDKLTTMDEGDADFTLVGWANDTFAYYVNRHNYQAWQPKATAIKTYNAATGKLTVAYQTGAVGAANAYASERLNWIQQIGTKLVWYTSWGGYGPYYNDSASQMSDKQAQLVEYDTVGNSQKVLKAYSLAPAQFHSYIYYNPMSSYQSIVYKPHEIYFIIGLNDGSNSSYYSEYEDGKFTENSDEAKTYFQGSQGDYPTYLDSPSATLTLWADQRDGKNALFVGDNDGANGKQIATLSDYSPYGWYSDNYLLVSKNGSELYIMAADGSTPPQKISDYYKPPTTYRGYGGGYGGI